MPARPRLLALPALALVGAVLLGGHARGGDLPALGPAPREPDGRFLNLGGPIERAGASALIPFSLRRIGAMLRDRPGAPEVVPNDGAFLRENAAHSTPTVTWVGHATLLVQMDHVTFLTDPIWSERASPLPFGGPGRLVPPGLALGELPPVDFVLISHNHYDHLDLPTLRALAARDARTRFLVPLENASLLRESGLDRVEELDWGEVRHHAAVTIHCLPAQHWSRRGPRDERRALWASWAVVGPQRRLYFAGDTGYFAGFPAIGRALGPFDLAALPIGAYLPPEIMRPFHMTPEEAVRAGRELGARRLLAVHFGTFDLSDEPLDEPPRRFLEAGRVEGYPSPDLRVLRIGESGEF